MKRILSAILVIIAILANLSVANADATYKINNVQVDNNCSIVTINGVFPDDVVYKKIQVFTDSFFAEGWGYDVNPEDILQLDAQTIKFKFSNSPAGQYYIRINLNDVVLQTDICIDFMPSTNIQGDFSDELSLNTGDYYINGDLTIEETGSLKIGDNVKLVVKPNSNIIIKGSVTFGQRTELTCFNGNYNVNVESSDNVFDGVSFNNLNCLTLNGNNKMINCSFTNCNTAISLKSENSLIEHCRFFLNNNAFKITGMQNKIRFCDFSDYNLDINWISGENNEIRYNNFWRMGQKNIQAGDGNNFSCKYNYFYDPPKSDVTVESQLPCDYKAYIEVSGIDGIKKVGETFEVKLINMFPEYTPENVEFVLGYHDGALREVEPGEYTAIHSGEEHITLYIDGYSICNYTILVSSSLADAPFDIFISSNGYTYLNGEREPVDYGICISTQKNTEEPIYYTLILAAYDKQNVLLNTKIIQKQVEPGLAIESIPITKEAYFIKCFVMKPGTILPYSEVLTIGDGNSRLIYK